MKIRFLKPYGMSAIGDIIEPDMIGIAQLLIQRGIAEEVKEELPAQSKFAAPNKMVHRDKVKTK